MRLTATLFSTLFLIPGLFAQSTTIQVSDLLNLRNVAVSQDASEIYFASGRNALGDVQGATNLYRVRVLGSRSLDRLTNYPNDSLFAGVSHVAYPGTGSRVAYSYIRDTQAQDEDIHVLDTSNGTDRTVATDREGCARIVCTDCYTTCTRNVHMTPDGNSVLYAMARQQPFYTVKSDGTGLQHLSIHEGSLARSGQRVISQAQRFVFTSAAPSDPAPAPQATDVYLVNLDGTNLQQVTRFTSADRIASNAVINSAGDMIAFEFKEGTAATQIWIVRADGTGTRRISGGSTPATTPSISADGRTVTFVQDGQVKQVSDLNSPNAAQVTSFSLSGAQNPILSADGRFVTFHLGPLNGLPAAIYSASVNAVSSFTQLTQIFAPRVIFPAGLVSAGGTAPPSVGSLMTAYGANLGKEEFAAATSLPLPMMLGGIEVLDELEPLPIQAATPWQVNVQIPQSKRPGTIGIRIRENGVSSLDGRVLARAAAPEAIPMYAVSAPGELLAAAVYPGTKTLADAANAAPANQVLEVYALGLGVTTPRVDGGAASPPLARADVTPRAQIGGIDAEVTFAGLVPGLAGVYQVNLKIPAGLAPGYQTLRWVANDGSKTGTSGIYVR